MPEHDARDHTDNSPSPPEIDETSRHDGSIPTGLPGGLPRRIGRFEVRALLGEGAFGRVYRGSDSELRRDVAIKVPHLQGLTDEFRERFLREARATATIYHPNVCPVYEVGTDGELPYIVMRFVPGTTLAALIARSGAMPPRSALSIVRKLALGIAAAHAQGVVHRDLKPANVLYDKAAREVLLTDFGLARVQGESQLTARDSFLGTPAYMSPEQANRQVDKIGPLSDVYSLGVILYQMLTGRVPFTGSVIEVAIAHCLTQPEPPSKVHPGLDPRLDALCLKAMAKSPFERYRSAREFADVMTDYLRPSDGRPVTGTYTAIPALPPPVPPAPKSEEAVETVAEKRTEKHTTPAFEVVPPPKVTVAELDESSNAELQPPRNLPPPRPSKKKRHAHARRSHDDSIFQNKTLWAVVGVVVLGVVILAVVLLTRGKRPVETVQQTPPTDPAPAPAKPQPQPQTQPQSQPQPQPQPPVVSPQEKLRTKIVGRWKLISGLGVSDKDLKGLEAANMFMYFEFRPDGTAQMGGDSPDLLIKVTLATRKDTKPYNMKYRVISGEQVEAYDIPKDALGGAVAGSEKWTVVVEGDSMTLIGPDASLGRLTRITK